MRMRWSMFVTAAVLTALAGVAAAHHSFTATYFEDRTMEIEGKLLQFQFRNPHSFVHVEAPDENGKPQRWAVEWGGAGQLSGQGVTNQTLRVGDIGDVEHLPEEAVVAGRIALAPPSGVTAEAKSGVHGLVRDDAAAPLLATDVPERRADGDHPGAGTALRLRCGTTRP